MDKKVVLITGCSSGIGRSTALILMEKRFSVFATARREEDLKALNDIGVEALHLDLQDSSSVDRAVGALLEKTDGRLDVLINNAGYAVPGAIEDLALDEIRAQFETNVFGAVNLIQQLIPVMRKQGSGRIIQLSSILGIVTMPYRGAYCASKYAIESFCDALRMELKTSDIDVVLIEPGPIVSQFRDNARKVFEKTFAKKEGFHQEVYQSLYQQEKNRKKLPFALGPEAVVKKILLAIESKNPKPRYYITFPAYFMMSLRRILPTSALDWVMSRLGR